MPVTAISLATGCLLGRFLGVGTVESMAGAVSSTTAVIADGLSGKPEVSFSCEYASGARRQTAPRMQSQTTGEPAKQGLLPNGTFTDSQSRLLANRAPGQWNQARTLPECIARSVGCASICSNPLHKQSFSRPSSAQPGSQGYPQLIAPLPSPDPNPYSTATHSPEAPPETQAAAAPYAPLPASARRPPKDAAPAPLGPLGTPPPPD
jgi:hypothetical protein